MRFVTQGSIAALAAAALLLTAPRGAEAQAGFCGDPIHGYPVWCDPVVDGYTDDIDPADPTETGVALIPDTANGAKRGMCAHTKSAQAVPSPLVVAADASGQRFCGRADGQKIPAGEKVAFLFSTSLGAVTRNAVNGGMPHGVRIDDPALNGRAQAVVVAGRVATPGASVSAVGAWYDGAHWWLYNEDLSPMKAAESFAYAEGSAVGGRVVHDAANDYQGHGVYLDDARLNGNPDAVVIPLHGFTGAYNPSPLGVRYDAVRAQWLVYNESGAALAFGETIHYIGIP